MTRIFLTHLMSDHNKRLTDEEVLLDYWRIMGQEPAKDPRMLSLWMNLVGKIREDEPRINRGAHMADYLNICDDDDDMDSFYGPNYFSEFET